MHDSEPLSQFLKITKKTPNCPQESLNQTQGKICVLLVEDVDVVFEQDDGFLNALWQLAMTSKRPIILTTTDDGSPNIEKFMAQYPVITFKPLTASSLATWLQIVCAVEGVPLSLNAVQMLLEANAGDARRTILQLQFIVQSGGNLSPTSGCKILSRPNRRNSIDEELEFDDDNSNISFIGDRKSDGGADFVTFEYRNEIGGLPLGKLWWNISNILPVKIEEHKEDCAVKLNTNLRVVSKLYESLVLTDILKRDCISDLEPAVRQWDTGIRDSLEFRERSEYYDGNLEFGGELCRYFTESCVERYWRLNNCVASVNLGVPTLTDKR